jgi:hypothetical protein
MGSVLSGCDSEHLAQLQKKFQLVRDRVADVAKGYHAGCIVTGRGGTGKSWTATDELGRLGTPFVLHNSHLTPRALFDQLADHPTKVHLIEDAEEVTRNPIALGVLRSATWGSCENREGRVERLVTWRAHGATNEVVFEGGLVLISNRALGALPEVRALATRIPCIELTVFDDEIAALMRTVALKGYGDGNTRLNPKECAEVAEFVISASAHHRCPLDMRLLINAFADRRQAEDRDSGLSWQDLVSSTLRGGPSVLGAVEAVGLREQQKAPELEVARDVLGLNRADRLRVWQERTGKSEPTLYRRLAELGRLDSTGFHA